MEVLKSPCLFEANSFGEPASIFTPPEISTRSHTDLDPAMLEDSVSELGELLSDLCTTGSPVAQHSFSNLPERSGFAENAALDVSASSASSKNASNTSKAYLTPHQFFARLRRHFESTMFFDHVESLLRRSNRVFFSGETIVRPSVHFYLVLSDEFCRNDNLSSFLRCVGQRIAPEWSDRYNRDHRLTHACHTFYVTASIAAKSLSVFEPRSQEYAECEDTFRVSELWTEAMEQARQTIDLLKPEFSMCHSFVGCEGASILSEEMNYGPKGVKNRLRAEAAGMLDPITSMDMSSLDTNALPKRDRKGSLSLHKSHGSSNGLSSLALSSLALSGDKDTPFGGKDPSEPVFTRSSSTPPDDCLKGLPDLLGVRSLSPEPIARSQSAVPYLQQAETLSARSNTLSAHNSRNTSPHHGLPQYGSASAERHTPAVHGVLRRANSMTDDFYENDEISSVHSFDTARSLSPSPRGYASDNYYSRLYSGSQHQRHSSHSVSNHHSSRTSQTSHHKHGHGHNSYQHGNGYYSSGSRSHRASRDFYDTEVPAPARRSPLRSPLLRAAIGGHDLPRDSQQLPPRRPPALSRSRSSVLTSSSYDDSPYNNQSRSHHSHSHGNSPHMPHARLRDGFNAHGQSQRYRYNSSYSHSRSGERSGSPSPFNETRSQTPVPYNSNSHKRRYDTTTRHTSFDGYNGSVSGSESESNSPAASRCMTPQPSSMGFPGSRQEASASLSPLRRSKRKRTIPGRFQQSITGAALQQTTAGSASAFVTSQAAPQPPLSPLSLASEGSQSRQHQNNQKEREFQQNPDKKTAGSTRRRLQSAPNFAAAKQNLPKPRGNRADDLMRWKRLASDISARLKRRRFSPQAFLN